MPFPVGTRLIDRKWHRSLPAVLLLQIALIAAAWWGSTFWYRDAMDDVVAAATRENRDKLDRMVQFVTSSFVPVAGIPQVLAYDASLQKAATIGTVAASAETSPLLDYFAQRLGADVVWLLNADGICIAASNYQTPESFVGVDYSDRLYYQDPKQGKLGRQFAVGRKTGIPGLFFSAPITVNGRFAGIVALKSNLPQLTSRQLQPGTFITDAQGVVILNHDPGLALHIVPQSAASLMKDLDRQRQYSTAHLPPVPISPANIAAAPNLIRFGTSPTPALLSSMDVASDQLSLFAVTETPQAVVLGKKRDHLFLIGAATLMLFSLGLIKIHNLRQQYLLEMANHQRDLEQQVAERTRDILSEVERRTKSEEAMRAAQTQAMQAAKLASVGQLAAGIAHEINTPTQYIGDNLRFIGESLTTVTNAIQVAETLLQQGDPALSASFAQQVDTEDLKFLQTELATAVKDSLEGVGQVARIVLSMKEFSHPGTHTKTTTDINRALESTLTVSRNVWKHVAEITRAYAPDLPTVLCLAGEMNQVFLNLIVNAAQAIEESQKPFPGHITVTTLYDDDTVRISVADTGNGVPAAIREKIFDPFFTTKIVGKGTGQGLAICYDVVVNKHNGRITLDTQEGQGATFTVHLPRCCDEDESAAAGA